MLTFGRFIQMHCRQALRPNAQAVAENKAQGEPIVEAEAAAEKAGQDHTPPSAMQDSYPANNITGVSAHKGSTPLHLGVPEQLQHIRAAAARPAVRPQQPRESLQIRLVGVAGWLERFILRQKTTSALFFAYCILLWRLFGEVGLLGAEPLKLTTTEIAAGDSFLDLEVDAPLVRPEWPARRATTGGKHFQRAKKSEVSEDDDDALNLAFHKERHCNADSQQDPLRRALLLAQCHAALGRIHSSRGHYSEMLQAMSVALRSGADAGDREMISNFQIVLGHLEMNHHRYFEAAARFEDALQTTTSNASRAEAFAGIGLSLLTLGHDRAAGSRFVEALGWMPVVAPVNLSTLAEAVARVAMGGNCNAHLDGSDGTRVLSLAGLAVANARHSSGQQFNDGGSASILLNCAVFLFHDIPTDEQDARTWHALGHARLVLADTNAARRYQQRAALREHRDPKLAAANPRVFSCATAADLPSCSHSALHLGLVEFSSGNPSLGMEHVEVLLSRTSTVPGEAAEWLTRFARAHSGTTAGHEFSAFLMERAKQLSNSTESKVEAR